MTFLYSVFLVGCVVLLFGGLVEQRRHYANLNRIPDRIMVNGIRGKSSITRLCAGALRGGGLVTVAKTTGTAARFIHPDGSEQPVYRKFGIANVIEQIGIVRRAAAYRPDALVVECMAVAPELQEISQDKMIRSNIGVLCNVREDHLAEMGPTLDDVAMSLSRTMPAGGVCVTAERERLPLLKREAARRGCALIAVHPDSVTDEEMAGFSWITFKENVAIALAVAELFGVNRQSALEGMWSAPPDPGVLAVKRYLADGKLLRVANVFAANDPESTLLNVRSLLGHGGIRRPLHLVINCRPDRMERNGQMGALVTDIKPDRIVLIGTPTRSARATIPRKWHDAIVDLGGTRGATELVEEILSGVDGQASLVAIGNIHGQGELLLEQLGKLPEAAADSVPAPRDREPGRRDRRELPRPTPYPRRQPSRAYRPPDPGRVPPPRVPTRQVPAGGWVPRPSPPPSSVTQPLPRLRPRYRRVP
jgi:gamma-polyglutamate synthase